MKGKGVCLIYPNSQTPGEEIKGKNMHALSAYLYWVSSESRYMHSLWISDE